MYKNYTDCGLINLKLNKLKIEFIKWKEEGFSKTILLNYKRHERHRSF